RDEEVGQVDARDLEVAAGDVQLDRVLADLGMDIGQVLARAVEGLDRGLELHVELVQLALDRGDLGALFADLVRLSRPRQRGHGKRRDHRQGAGATGPRTQGEPPPVTGPRRHGRGLYQPGWTATTRSRICLPAANSCSCSPVDTFDRPIWRPTNIAITGCRVPGDAGSAKWGIVG